jgi:hypothetical protein
MQTKGKRKHPTYLPSQVFLLKFPKVKGKVQPWAKGCKTCGIAWFQVVRRRTRKGLWLVRVECMSHHALHTSLKKHVPMAMKLIVKMETDMLKQARKKG